MIALVIGLSVAAAIIVALAVCAMAGACDDWDEVHLHIRRS